MYGLCSNLSSTWRSTLSTCLTWEWSYGPSSLLLTSQQYNDFLIRFERMLHNNCILYSLYLSTLSISRKYSNGWKMKRYVVSWGNTLLVNIKSNSKTTEQVRYSRHGIHISMPPTFKLSAFWIFPSWITSNLCSNNMMLKMYWCSQLVSRWQNTMKTLERHWEGHQERSKEQSSSHCSSGPFPSSLVQSAVTFTTASFLLNHSEVLLAGYGNAKFNWILPPTLLGYCRF